MNTLLLLALVGVLVALVFRMRDLHQQRRLKDQQARDRALARAERGDRDRLYRDLARVSSRDVQSTPARMPEHRVWRPSDEQVGRRPTPSSTGSVFADPFGITNPLHPLSPFSVYQDSTPASCDPPSTSYDTSSSCDVPTTTSSDY